MRIASLNCGQQPNFKGILKQTDCREYNDNAKEAFVREEEYNYFPFADETDVEIEKIRSKYNYSEYIQHPYPSWDEFNSRQVEVKAPLSITKAQYETLIKENMSDDFILKTFA